MSITPQSPDQLQATPPLRLGVIIGSTRQGRAGRPIADWLVAHAQPRTDYDVDLIDLAETALPTLLPDFDVEQLPEPVVSLGERLSAADAFVVVTPEYNHSFPAALKNAIDWYHEEWHAKPVGFVSYGGRAEGARAVEQLRQVFPELHATTIRDVVGIDLDMVDGRGWPVSPGCDGAAKIVLDQLAWWAQALRTARMREPYRA
ncbi:NADPH-dependent oxidoreductase [Egibacter rhizosphaerae]|uniref:NADPH-dependent oxidoreductase n=1 Tax=Egibacter rhizosphaerae TaxID=1670831 RepID=A0A411YEF9_9ACTN|nr:NAD(P)H-dependent oxidoreductase [Egibacter rhizosphaerae]QBI19605.1 NADPH-dependent oxidoreductase [Egibacter rhizosphaerae]